MFELLFYPQDVEKRWRSKTAINLSLRHITVSILKHVS